ncbi:MAG TPA: hypothetical protein VNA69_16500 [Thermoanaerobaculia bacterium]|nr:hypothetical protein [Thermoanaerobaculia bacterium]
MATIVLFVLLTTTTATAPPQTATARTTTTATAAPAPATRDAEVVEIQIAQRVADRLMSWAKLFGFFVGIPLALIAAWLGFLGYKSAADFKALTARLESLRAELADAEKQVALRREQLARLNELDAMQTNLEQLQQKVQRLENVSFSGSGATGDVQQKLEPLLARYQSYLQKIGWTFDGGKPSPIFRIADDSEQGPTMTYYDGRTATMFVGTKYIDETDLTLRAYTHHVLMQAKAMPHHVPDFELTWRAVEYGLAAYFPCSFNNTPAFAAKLYGKPSIDLATTRGFDETPRETYKLAEVWAAMLWSIRESHGAETTDRLIFATWRQFRPDPDKTFNESFATALFENAGAGKEHVRAAAEKRGISV